MRTPRGARTLSRVTRAPRRVRTPLIRTTGKGLSSFGRGATGVSGGAGAGVATGSGTSKVGAGVGVGVGVGAGAAATAGTGAVGGDCASAEPPLLVTTRSTRRT